MTEPRTRDERDFAYGKDRDADQFWLQTIQALTPIAFGGNPSGAQFQGAAGQQADAGQSAAAVWKLIEEGLRRRGGGEG